MMDDYLTATQSFKTILDFLRFGLSSANKEPLHYGHGSDNAWDDIYALILGSLSLPLDVDPSLLKARLSPIEKEHLTRQLERRIKQRIPVAYLTKRAYFCGLPFYVDERVLIPRSPIGELIQQQFSPWIDETQVFNILEIGTGSGCIAIACAYAFPDAMVDAVDISKDALAVATINRNQHQLESQLTLIESDCFAALPPKKYDIIVSNPPYVGRDEMQTLPAEYNHEPNLALETANNGLFIVDKILHQAKDYLSDEGILVVEVGNTEELLVNTYPTIPFTWLEMERGGQGVFILTAEQLKSFL